MSDARDTEAGGKKSDESWKDRAEAEKRRLDEEASRDALGELPPASFGALIEELAFQAMVALGRLANPLSGQLTLSLDVARYQIDMLAVLQDKTQGNLEPAEERALSELLHSLRLAYVDVSREPPGPDATGSDPSSSGESTDEDAGPRIIV